MIGLFTKDIIGSYIKDMIGLLYMSTFNWLKINTCTFTLP